MNIVEITADHVTLDLNGFSIRCLWVFTPCAGNGTGIGIYGFNRSNVVVRNGTVREMGSHGLEIGPNGRLENVALLDNGGDGAQLDSASGVHASRAAGNAGSGFRVRDGSTVESSVSNANLYGVYVQGRGALIRDNVIQANSSNAIYSSTTPSDVAYGGNVLVGNNGTNTIIDGDQGISGTPIGSNFCGTDTTCP